MVIDSHHHFWRYIPAEYGWIADSMSILRRDFLPADLSGETSVVGVDGVISVQARQTVGETQWLLDLAEQNAFIKGVVGWVPLVSPDVKSDLEQFARRPKLKAVRHVLQDEPDDNYMLRDDFNRGLAMLRDFDLRYDILIFERHLPQSIKLIDRHPRLTFILDHIAKPRIRENVLSPWRENMRELARRPNVYCKLSGMATVADHKAWTPAQLRPCMDMALEAFGPGRLMFGSDWPVCLLAVTYRRWYELVGEFVARLSTEERGRIMGGTAVEAYGLP
jgi:L-fuconolactonase